MLLNGFVITLQIKTKKSVMVPLNERAIALLKMRVLDQVFSNHQSNKYVKEALFSTYDIPKGTHHLSLCRHTFATNSLLLGITVEVLQQFLGHKKIQTTMIYAKVANQIKEQSMQKWNIPPSGSIVADSPYH